MRARSSRCEGPDRGPAPCGRLNVAPEPTKVDVEPREDARRGRLTLAHQPEEDVLRTAKDASRSRCSLHPLLKGLYRSAAIS